MHLLLFNSYFCSFMQSVVQLSSVLSLQRGSLALIFLFASLLSSAQETPTLSHSIDSISIAVFNIQTKQMTTLEGAPYKKQLGKKTITKKEAQKLLKLLSLPSTYQGNRAMLDHHNIEIYLYSNKEVEETLYISTFTWNISVINPKNAETDFYKNLSKKGRKVVLKLLSNNNLLSVINEEDILKD